MKFFSILLLFMAVNVCSLGADEVIQIKLKPDSSILKAKPLPTKAGDNIATVNSFEDFAGTQYSSSRVIQMNSGQNMMIMDPLTNELTSIGLDGVIWKIGYYDYQGYIIGWCDNPWVDYEGYEGWLRGEYTSDLIDFGDPDKKPDGMWIIKDTNGDGIGTFNFDTATWQMGDDDIFYTHEDVLFGPEMVRGDILQLPAFDPLPSLPPLPDMAIHKVSPVPISPNDISDSADLDLILQWQSQSENFTHDLYFGDDKDNLELIAENLTVTTFDIGSLSWQHKYYWQIIEHDGDSEYAGDIFSFTTMSPVVTNPASMAVEIDPDLDISWQNATDRTWTYNIYFSESGAPLTLIAENTSTATITMDRLKWSTWYNWQIDVIDGDTTYTGPLLTFKTIVPTCPTPPAGDLNSDCAVDINDLAIIAANWMECQWQPIKACP